MGKVINAGCLEVTQYLRVSIFPNVFQLVLIVQALCSTWSVSQYQVPSFQLQHWCSRCRCSYVVPFLSSSPVQIQHIECQLPSEDCLDLFSQTGISSSEFLQPCNHFHIIFVKCSLKACVCVCVCIYITETILWTPETLQIKYTSIKKKKSLCLLDLEF